MRVLCGSEWKDGFLSYYCSSESSPIDVKVWVTIDRIEDMYFVPKRSFRLIFNYLREIGIKEVFKKVVSRRKEKLRNDKYISFGIGLAKGDLKKWVFFIAPDYPRAVDYISVHKDLVIDIETITNTLDKSFFVKFYEAFDYIKSCSGIFYGDESCITISDKETLRLVDNVKGWSSYSGIPFNSIVSEKKKIEFYACLLRYIDWRQLSQVLCGANDIAGVNSRSNDHSCIRHDNVGTESLPTAALYGYGQYAKTNIIPNVSDVLNINEIHEVDPTQIPLDYLADNKKRVSWYTSPYPTCKNIHDVYFVAGFHHTHADIAIHALNKGSIAVVEKPLVVDTVQLKELLHALRKSEGVLYSCFHKRYSRLNNFALEDLKVKSGDAVNYHCVVYEVKLPKLHWYNWPNSHSRIVSNACHWIDHFLFLNAYPDVVDLNAVSSQDGTINISIKCSNGAFFTMVLTDIGSQRIGLQEYIELRKADVTVKINNNSLYVSENTNRVLRREKVNKLEGHRIMYHKISRDVKKREICDSLRQIRITHETMIEIEDILQRAE